MYFPLFLPLQDNRKGNKGNFLFSHCLPLYQAALRIPAWLFLLSEHRHSLWYWRLSVLIVPAHPLVLLRLPEGYLCRCGATGESEILQIHPDSVQSSCKQFLMYLAVPDFRPVLSRHVSADMVFCINYSFPDDTIKGNHFWLCSILWYNRHFCTNHCRVDYTGSKEYGTD